MPDTSTSKDRGRVTTFLMGDLVGSTAHWLAAPEAMEAALRTHDEIVARAVSSASGRLFKHTGDGFLAQFDDPDDAVRAARSVRDGLAGAPPELTPYLRARLAIDTGWATPRDDDWFGPTVNRLARVADLVSDAGVVMTRAAAEMMRHSDSGEDLGEVTLRSHREPIGLLGLDGATIVADEAESSTLPRPRSTFVGRREEVNQLGALLDERQLVTVVGTGGAGKTRLAIEVAGARPQHAGFVDLVSAREPLEVARQVALGAGVDVEDLSAAATLEEIRAHVAGHIGERDRLLVLDNCEHVLDQAREEVDALLSRCPNLTILATSRERLGARGERVWLLPSMDVGADLFRDRAEAHGVELGSEPDVLDAVEQICAHLDGLPLAIELAAARLVEVGLGELLTDLDALMVREGGDEVDGLGRGRTMRDVVEMSHRALPAAAQHLFERVSLLEGSFRVDDVALLGDVDASALSTLVRRSLVVQERDGLELLHRMLEPVRQVAGALLVERGEYDAAMEQLVAGLRRVAATEYGGGYWDWATLDHLRPLLPTFWRAAEWLDRQDRQLDLLTFVAEFAGVANVYADSRRVIQVMSARVDLLERLDTEQQARVLVGYALAGIAAMETDHTVAGVIALYELDLGAHPAVAFAHRSAALGAMNRAFIDGEDSPFALEMLALARTVAAATPSNYERAAVEAFEGWALLLEGRWEEVVAASELGMRHVAAENVWHLILATNAGMALVRLGRAQEALDLARSHPDRSRHTYWGDTLMYVEALALADLGRHDEACAVLGSSIRRVLGSTHPGHRSDLVLVCAWVAVATGRPDDAAALLAHPVATRGPHTMQLCRGLEEATGAAAIRVELADRVDRVESALRPILEAELERIESASTAGSPASDS